MKSSFKTALWINISNTCIPQCTWATFIKKFQPNEVLTRSLRGNRREMCVRKSVRTLKTSKHSELVRFRHKVVCLFVGVSSFSLKAIQNKANTFGYCRVGRSTRLFNAAPLITDIIYSNNNEHNSNIIYTPHHIIMF